MRDPKRLEKFYEEIKRIHQTYFPDWRFGQLCSNFFGWIFTEKAVDMFFVEENDMIRYLREYAGENKKTCANCSYAAIFADGIYCEKSSKYVGRSSEQSCVVHGKGEFYEDKNRLCN